MKRKLLIAALGLVVFVILIQLLGLILVRLGMRPFFIQTDNSGRIRLVQATAPPALPALVPMVAPQKSADARQVIIDTDMAPDDWMAILYLLNRPDVEVRAITIAATGEAHCEPGLRHALDLVLLAGQPQIPVACGREMPLVGDHTFPASWRESVDNLLGLTLPENQITPAGETAVDLVRRMAGEAPSGLWLVALGPMTNVAEALEAEPALAGQLQGITIMGGALNVPGNVGTSSDIDNDVAEWNFYIDPHAAAVVLGSKVPVALVPLDATDDTPVTMAFYERLGNDRSTSAAEFVYRVLTMKESSIRAGGYDFWDPLTVAVFTDESLVTFQDFSLAIIEQEGPQSGHTVVSDDGQVVRVAVNASQPRFEQLFLDILNRRVP